MAAKFAGFQLKRRNWRFRCGAKFEISLWREIRAFRLERGTLDFAVAAELARFRCGAELEISLGLEIRDFAGAAKLKIISCGAKFEISLKREIGDFAVARNSRFRLWPQYDFEHFSLGREIRDFTVARKVECTLLQDSPKFEVSL